MSYQALYRRFRPDRFDGIAGQDAVTSVLKAQVASGHVSHAYLFSGPRGNGKTSTARVFARAVNCENPVQGEPCGQCAFCKAAEEGVNTDIIEIDAASNRGIDEIRELRSRTSFLPAIGRYRVYIIDEIHMLTTEAFNALLKTLEEPPAHIIFVMATTEISKIPATVLSRCLRFDFKRLPPDIIEERIIEVMSALDRHAAQGVTEIIAASADGAMRDALGILDKVIGYKEEGLITADDVRSCLGLASEDGIRTLASAILKSEPSEALDAIDSFLSSGVEVSGIYNSLISFFRDMLITANSDHPDRLLKKTEEEIALYRTIAALTSNDFLIAAITELSKNRRDARLIPNPRHLLESCVLTLCVKDGILENYTLKSRLEKLEKRLEGLAAAGSPAQTGMSAGRDPAGISAGRQTGTAPSAPELQEQAVSAPPEHAKPEKDESPVGKGSQSAIQTANPAEKTESLDSIQSELAFAGKFILNKERNILLGDLFPKLKAAAYDGQKLAVYPTGDAVHMMTVFDKRGGLEKLTGILAERLGRPILISIISPEEAKGFQTPAAAPAAAEPALTENRTAPADASLPMSEEPFSSSTTNEAGAGDGAAAVLTPEEMIERDIMESMQEMAAERRHEGTQENPEEQVEKKADLKTQSIPAQEETTDIPGITGISETQSGLDDSPIDTQYLKDAAEIFNLTEFSDEEL